MQTKRIVTLRLKKHGVVKNEIEVEPITERLFLEFGKRVGESYEYVALMEGDPNYTRAKEVKQLYFTHQLRGEWWVYDDTCLELVERHATKERAVERLRELANQEAEKGNFDIDKALGEISVEVGSISNLKVPKCPACGKDLRIGYTERGTMVWDGKRWSETDRGTDAEYYCLECDYKLDYEGLEKLGVF